MQYFAMVKTLQLHLNTTFFLFLFLSQILYLGEATLLSKTNILFNKNIKKFEYLHNVYY